MVGATGGIVVGTITARYRSMQDSLMPFAVAASSVPILASRLVQQLVRSRSAAVQGDDRRRPVFFPVRSTRSAGSRMSTAALVFARWPPRRRRCSGSSACPPCHVFTALRLAATWRRSALSSASISRPPGEPRTVHRHVLRIPQLRAVAAIVPLRDRDRPVRRGDRRMAARCAHDARGRSGADARPTPDHVAIAHIDRTSRSLDCDGRRRGPRPSASVRR